MISILYVDDEEHLRNATRMYLTGLGVNVDTAESGPESLDMLKTGEYDVIVSDYEMPGMNGITLLKEVRIRYPNLPFILFTGKGREEVVIEALNNGADFYLQKGGKPLPQYTELIHQVGIAIDKRKTEEQLKILNRLYSVLFATSKAIGIRGSKQELFQEICRILVEIGGFRMAWIGIADTGERSIVPVASSGHVEGYLDFVEISTEDVPLGQGPTGTAFREQRYYYSNDITLDSRLAPWRDECLKRGYRANAAFPFSPGTPNAGVLTVYAPVTGFYTDKVIGLLEELTNTLSQALKSIDDYEEKQAMEEALRESEARLHHAEEVAGLGHWSFLCGTGIVLGSQGARKIYGLDEREWSISEIQQIPLPRYRQFLDESLKRLINEGTPYDVEFKIRRKNDGAIIDIHSIAEYDPAINRVFGIIKNITERKSVEEALRESEAKFRLFVENVNDMIFSVDIHGIITYISPAGERMFGYLPSDLMGRPFTDVVYPDDLTLLKRRFDRLKQGSFGPLEWRLVKKDGTFVWVRTSTRSVVDTNGNYSFFGVVIDITREKEVMTALLESEEKYHSLVRYSLEPVMIVDLQGKVLDANMAAAHMLDFEDYSELCGRNVIEFVAPESYGDVIRDFEEVSRGHDGYLAEYRVITPTGRKIWVESIGKVIHYEKQYADLLSVRDITERKSAEEKLRRSEERFRSYVENSYDIMYSLTQEGIFTYISPNWPEILGHDDHEIVGRSFETLIHPDDVHGARTFLNKVMSTGKKQAGIEYRVRGKDDLWRWHVSNISPIYDTDGNFLFLGIARDITDRKRSEEALRLANRQLNLMSSVTRHDILNQVMTIYLLLDAAEKGYPHPAMKKSIGILKSCTEAIQDQIEFTKIYDDMGMQEPQWQELNTVLPLSYTPDSICFNRDLQGISIYADAMLSRVFSNLLDNSLRHGQRVTTIWVSSVLTEAGLTILWEDDGIGISSGEKELIFERGFGKNTGFGLFLARDVLSLTGITIRETGEEGRGARFEIMVPAGKFRSGY